MAFNLYYSYYNLLKQGDLITNRRPVVCSSDFLTISPKQTVFKKNTSFLVLASTNIYLELYTDEGKYFFYYHNDPYKLSSTFARFVPEHDGFRSF